MSTHANTHDNLAHLGLGAVVGGLFAAFSTLWRGASRRRLVGLGRELRRRVVRWFTKASSGTRSGLGCLPASVVRRAEPVGHQHLRCMRWIALCSARDDDSHSLAA